MECEGNSEKIGQQAGEIACQAQAKKDGIVDKARETLDKATNDETLNKYTTQATNFLQQTGEQVKSMAQGAAEVVKNTLGINNDSTSSTEISSASTTTTPEIVSSGSASTATESSSPSFTTTTAKIQESSTTPTKQI